MTAKRLPVDLTVLMGNRDVTAWCTSLDVRQPENCLYREWTATFRGWHNIQPAERWDVYASYDSSTPKAELLVRQGVVPPDRQPEVTYRNGEPDVTVEGYDWVWLAQRLTPRQTLVVAGSTADAHRAVQRYDGPLGRYRIHLVTGMRMSSVVNYLGTMAGVNVESRLPDWPLGPFVVAPTLSYWGAIRELIAPWAPYVYYRPETNTIVVTDPATAQSPVGTVTELPERMVRDFQGLPSRHRKVQRVILRVDA